MRGAAEVGRAEIEKNFEFFNIFFGFFCRAFNNNGLLIIIGTDKGGKK